MKKGFLTIVFLFVFGFGNSQELMNFYLSPNIPSSDTPFSTEETTILLHTTFYAFTGAGFNDYFYTIEDNVINFKLCYGVGSTGVTTLDKQVFELNMPSFEGDYTFNIELYTDYDGTTCYYEDITYSGSVDFSFPYYPIEKVEITDPAFESYLEYLDYGDDEFDNGFVYTHKIENITSLYFTSSDFEMDGIIESLFGINFFKSLINLRCYNQSISDIDLEDNPDLEFLWCEENPLEYLNISNNAELKILWTGGINLSLLDITNNINLEWLQVSGNNLSNLDLSNNINLTKVSIGTSQINNIDLSNNINIQQLTIENSQLTNIDLGNNILLENLNLSYNELLTSLNVSNLNYLTIVNCSFNNLTDLDLSSNNNLLKVFLLFNDLNYLSIKNGNNENIEEVYTNQNPDLYCIEVDSVDGPQPFDYSIDSQTEFSEDCSTPVPSSLLNKMPFAENNVNIYPNPTQNTIFIETQGQFVESIKIINIQGSMIKQVETTNRIDVSGLTTGMYFVQIYSEGNRITKKFIKL